MTKDKKIGMNEILPIAIMGCLFVIIQGLALLVVGPFQAAGMEAFENPDDPINLVYIFVILLAITVAILLIATPVLAVYYTATITAQETSGTDYDMLGFMQPADVDGMAADGYISATGNDTRVQIGTSVKPHMMVDDRVNFAIPMPADTTKTYDHSIHLRK